MTNSDRDNEYRARLIFRSALARKKIIKPCNCQGCGIPVSGRRLHGHHADYSRPLEVIWLCSGCHGKLGRRRFSNDSRHNAAMEQKKSDMVIRTLRSINKHERLCGRDVIAERRRYSITQSQLAKRLSVCNSSLADIENCMFVLEQDEYKRIIKTAQSMATESAA